MGTQGYTFNSLILFSFSTAEFKLYLEPCEQHEVNIRLAGLPGSCRLVGLHPPARHTPNHRYRKLDKQKYFDR